MTWLLVHLVLLYRVTLGRLLGGQCRFHPSCADYSAEAIQTHGAVRGVALTAVRLSKCHPFGRHGFDPVPQSLANQLDAGPRSGS